MPQWVSKQDAEVVAEIVRLAKIARTAALSRISVTPYSEPNPSQRPDSSSNVMYEAVEGSAPRPSEPAIIGHEESILTMLLMRSPKLGQRGETA